MLTVDFGKKPIRLKIDKKARKTNKHYLLALRFSWSLAGPLISIRNNTLARMKKQYHGQVAHMNNVYFITNVWILLSWVGTMKES